MNISERENLSKYEPRKKVDAKELDLEEIVRKSGIDIQEDDDGADSSETFDNLIDSADIIDDDSQKPSWKVSFRILIKKNAGILSILASLLILTEGIAIFRYPSWWWLPITVVGVLSAIVLIWHNARIVIKVGMSFAILLVISAFQMLIASSFVVDATQGLVLPSITILASIVFLIVASLFRTNVSKWTALQVSLIVAFMLSYAALPAGLIAAGIVSFISLIGTGCLWMSLRNMWARRKGSMPERPTTLLDYQKTKILDSIKGTKWRLAEYSKSKYPFYVLYRETDGKMIVLQSLDFRHSINESQKRGLTYRYRKIEEYFIKVMLYCQYRTDPNAIVLFMDWTGALKLHDIIRLNEIDSNSAYYVGLLDMSKTRRNISKDIEDMSRRFSYPRAKQGSVKRFEHFSLSERKVS